MIFAGRVLGSFLVAGVLLQLPTSAQETAGPTVTFAKDFPGSNPDHLFLSVSADGRASYDSTAKASSQSEDSDPVRVDFAISPDTCKRIFGLAAEANYFDGLKDEKEGDRLNRNQNPDL